MKLSVTAYEAEMLAMARSILDELNAELAKRGEIIGFGITAGAGAAITLCACASEPDDGRR